MAKKFIWMNDEDNITISFVADEFVFSRTDNFDPKENPRIAAFVSWINDNYDIEDVAKVLSRYKK